MSESEKKRDYNDIIAVLKPGMMYRSVRYSQDPWLFLYSMKRGASPFPFCGVYIRRTDLGLRFKFEAMSINEMDQEFVPLRYARLSEYVMCLRIFEKTLY